jgi:ABC-type branched-subunit amino acid transport system ATPase component/ABC-type branched-subunit amino acid transport system permease subunit
MYAVEILGIELTSSVLMLGLVTGMVYGLLAIGLVLVYRSDRIINFAHGEIGAFGAAVLGTAVTQWGLPYYLALAIALAVATGTGVAAEVTVVRRLRNAPIVLSVIATLGLGQFLVVFSAVVNGAGGAGNVYPRPPGFPDFSVGALRLTQAHTAMLLVTPVIVVALITFLRRGRTGIAMRAAAVNQDAARMAGIVTSRMSMVAWGFAGAVSAYTAILVLPTRGFTGAQFLGPGLLLRGLACAVIARMTNLGSALAAGVGLGILEQVLLANRPSSGVIEAVLFGVILVALLVQRGTFGRAADKGAWTEIRSWATLPDSYRELPVVRHLPLIVGAVVGCLALAAVPFISFATAVTLSIICIFTIVGLSVGVLTGLAGQLSLGQFALAGIGATVALRVQAAGLGFLTGVVAAAFVAALAAVLLGLPALRIRGLMPAVTTLSFALAAQQWLLSQTWMLGAGLGSSRPSFLGVDFGSSKAYYVLTLGGLGVVLWLVRNIWRSGIGRRLRAVRDNEDAARAFTVPARTVKLQGFALAGGIAGVGGALYGNLLAQVSANSFPIEASINAAAVAVIGGLGLLIGPLLGALYIVGIPEFLPLDNAGLAATSLGWLVLIMYAPGGIAELLGPRRDRLVDWIARRSGLDPAAERGEVPAGGVGAAGTAMHIPAPSTTRPAAGTPVLEVSGIGKSFGGIAAVRDVSMTVHAGETVGLIGANGAGKTTTFEMLSGFTTPDRGVVRFNGEDVSHLSPEARARRGLIRSFQDAALFPTMTVSEVVALSFERVDPTRLAPSLLGAGAADRRKQERARELLAMMGLHGYRSSPISSLSTGTRRITELACLIALEPSLLLLDEPTSGIAQRETEALAGVLQRIKDELDLTLVIIEHDIPLVMSISDRVIAMETGTVIADGPPDEVKEDPRVISSYLGGDVRAIERSDADRTETSAVPT